MTNIAVDAIVSNDDVNGLMYTVIASAIKAVAGQQVEDLSVDHGRSQPGKAWFTPPGRLSRLKGIIHVAAMSPRGQTSIDVICDCVRSALDEAVKHDCSSVAIGTFGTEPATPDRDVIEVGQWLDAVGPVIVDYLRNMPAETNLAVLIVLFEQEDYEACVARLKEACRSDQRFPAIPFTLANIKADTENVDPSCDGASSLEFRAATKELALEHSTLTYQRVPPASRFPSGHTHKTQEELYVVVRGSGRMKVDDEIVEVKEWDAVRVAAGAWRGYEAGPLGLEILVIGAPTLGKDPREDVESQRGWWID